MAQKKKKKKPEPRINFEHSVNPGNVAGLAGPLGSLEGAPARGRTKGRRRAAVCKCAYHRPTFLSRVRFCMRLITIKIIVQ